MSGWLLDTNVLSELAKPEPEPTVVDFVVQAVPAYVLAISLHELRFGIERLAEGRRKSALLRWLTSLEALYGAAIIPVGPAEATAAATLRAIATRHGRTLHLADGLIAGTAFRHDLAVATRNVGDFLDLPISVINPWAEAAEPGLR